MKYEAHMVILNATDAEQMVEQAYRLFNLVEEILDRRRVAIRPPQDDERAEVIPLRRPTHCAAPLEELF